MPLHRDTNPKFKAVRLLIRYVDDQQAVIDAVFTVCRKPAAKDGPMELHLWMAGPHNVETAAQSTVHLDGRAGMVRFHIDRPRRWWPASMGEQPLYDCRLTLLVGDESSDSCQVTLGLTSVRHQDPDTLLINGLRYAVDAIVAIKPDEEDELLTVGDQSLLLVRDHFAPDVLYEAADRAGLLLVQAVTHADSAEVRSQVDRLASHPSLVGWYVDRQAPQSNRLAHHLEQLDPTRKVLRQLPCAAS